MFNQLGVLFYIKADYAQAETLKRRALAIDEKTYGPDHPEVAIRVGNLDGSGTPLTLYSGETSPAGVAASRVTGAPNLVFEKSESRGRVLEREFVLSLFNSVLQKG